MHASIGPRFSRQQVLLAATLALLLVGVAGVATWKIVTGGDDNAAQEDIDYSTRPPHVVSLTDSSMTVALLDGTEATTTALPDGFDAMLLGDQGRWLLEDNHDSVLNYFDLSAAQPELRSIELPFSGWAIHPRTVRLGSDVVLLYSPDGSLGLAVVNLADGTAYPTASARAKYFLAGSVRDFLLFKEVDGLKTIVIPIADPAVFWTMNGAVVDIRGTTTLIATVDGPASYLRVYEGLQPIGVRAQVENPIMGGMLTDTGAVVLERTGGITLLDNQTGKVKRAGVSEFGAQGAIPVADDRLYGWGGDGSAILGADGLPIANYLLFTPTEGEPRPLVATAGGTGCLVLQPGPQLKRSGAGALLISVVDGAVLLEMDASPSWVSPDGCTLIGLDATLVIDGKGVEVGLDQVFSVSHDRSSVLGRRTAGEDATFVVLDLATQQVRELESGFHLFATF